MSWVEEHGKQDYVRSLIEHDMAASGCEDLTIDFDKQSRVLLALQKSYEALDEIHQVLDKENAREFLLLQKLRSHRENVLKTWNLPELREAYAAYNLQRTANVL